MKRKEAVEILSMISREKSLEWLSQNVSRDRAKFKKKLKEHKKEIDKTYFPQALRRMAEIKENHGEIIEFSLELDLNKLHQFKDNIEELKELVNDVQKLMLGMFNYQYDTSHFYLTNKYGKTKFSTVIGKKKLSIWDQTGGKVLGSVKIIDGRLEDGAINKLDCLMKLYIDGYLHCSGCSEKLHKEDIAGSIYAGRYCEECWESKFKEIKAELSYN